jgi:mono/diheme cytochrome c family protein
MAMGGHMRGDDKMRLLARRLGALVVFSAGLAGCQDPESGLSRGPTRAPGDTVPLFFIHSEEPTAMRALGEPNRPSGEPLAFPELDTAAAVSPAASAPAAQPAAPRAQATLPAGVTQALVDEGKTVFGSSCFACHGQEGAGGPLAPRLSDTEWLNIGGSYDEIVTLVNAGVAQPKQHPAPMPPKGGAPLTDEQVRAVAAYVFSISR